MSSSIKEEIRDIAIELVRELRNALRKEFEPPNHENSARDSPSSNHNLKSSHKRMSKSRGGVKGKPNLAEILELRRTNARRVSYQDVVGWYEEISSNPWASIISEKGKS
ncbi:MAG TPA: hypothetical protein EYP78_07045 [Candidatus Omnitrophica bacterium]|nr:hypothetical protein [Candidatus Omnitrophota bacterium]